MSTITEKKILPIRDPERSYVRRMFDRSPAEWAMDVSGLAVQSIAVPAAALMIAHFLRGEAPALSGALQLPGALSFLLNFVAVDYLYYWNHRLLHGPLWRWHEAHHTPKSMDVLITSRNTLWTPALIVYVWANALFVFLLGDPRPYLFAIAVSSLLDVWRHSGMKPPKGMLGRVLITPRDHAWHHSTGRHDKNFGANLKMWDRLHGTLWETSSAPKDFGIRIEGGLMKKWVMP
jgi:sterol desaturase/sphingolipid hydroxylase (fatty acid hydroxylase superfamily)